MRSVSQINASRKNGALSLGPVTTAGKNAIVQNAMTHGLTAKAVLLTIEDKPAFQSLMDSFVVYYNPVGQPEFALVEEMVTATWKLRRCWSSQTALLELQMDRDTAEIEKTIQDCDETTRLVIAEEHLAAEKTLERLRRYETALQLQDNRAYKRLRQMQADRKAAEAVIEPPQVPDPPQDTEIQNKPKESPEMFETNVGEPVSNVTADQKEADKCPGPSREE
jgi:hypothetical protein